VTSEEDLQILAEMPVFHMNRQSQFVNRPSSGKLGRWFLLRAARSILQSYEGGLNEALQSFSRLLYSWGIDAGSDLARRFDSVANRYRAQLERLLLDRKRTTVDSDSVRSDLENLSKMFVAEIRTTNDEAMAS